MTQYGLLTAPKFTTVITDDNLYDESVVKWRSEKPLPNIGDEVSYNGCTVVVKNYTVEDGWLGLTVKFDKSI